MRVAVTGTPGTGKTTAAERVETDLEVVHLNDVIEREELYDDVDEGRDSWIADLEAVRGRFEGREDLLIESHLAHHLPVDRVIVLRCRPDELERRLRERGDPGAKARENAESEALDLLLAEAVEAVGAERVYEIETTDRSPEDVAREIEAAVAGEREPSAGTVSYVEYL